MLTSRRFWKFTHAAPSRSSSAVANTGRAGASSEPKYMAEPSASDITGNDEDALRWAEKHDPETAALLNAEPLNEKEQNA